MYTCGLKKAVSSFLFALVVSSALLASATEEAAPQWTGTITMRAQAYTPNARDDESPLTAFREVADAYEAEHPGVTIEFLDEEIPDNNNDIRVKAAAGELYDVFWAQWASLNGPLPQGIAVDLAPYFVEPNPYAPDFATWTEAMNPTIVAETAAPSGASYNLNGDFVATAFFYNQALFEQAGVTEEPTSWPELLEQAAQLQEAGIPAAVGVPLYSWWQRHFLSDFYAEDYERIAAFDGAPAISALDEAVAIDQGLLSTEDPRFMAWWPIFKEFTDTWVPDYLALAPDQNAAAYQDFIGSQAAMLYEGSYTPNQFEDSGISFGYSSFNFPPLDSDVSEYSTGLDTSNAVGGPNAAYQYAMSTEGANSTMEEPGKFEAVLDWMRYIGTPDVAERVVNEEGSFIPTWSGTTPNPGSEALAAQANLELRTISVGNTSATLGDDLQRIFGLYLSDNLSLEDAQLQVQQALDRSVTDYARSNDVDLEQYGD